MIAGAGSEADRGEDEGATSRWGTEAAPACGQGGVQPQDLRRLAIAVRDPGETGGLDLDRKEAIPLAAEQVDLDPREPLVPGENRPAAFFENARYVVLSGTSEGSAVGGWSGSFRLCLRGGGFRRSAQLQS